MDLKRVFSLLITGSLMMMSVTSCKIKPDDADMASLVEAAVNNPDVMVEVKKAKVTLSGSVQNPSAKNSAEQAAKEVNGIEEVVNALTVAAPKPLSSGIHLDDAHYQAGIGRVKKLFSGIDATVNDGVITVTGKVEPDAIPRIMQAFVALRPKNIENKLTVK